MTGGLDRVGNRGTRGGGGGMAETVSEAGVGRIEFTAERPRLRPENAAPRLAREAQNVRCVNTGHESGR